MCPGTKEDGYSYSDSGIYKVIPPGDKEDYFDYIKSLPLNPTPEAFGLHSNAQITTSQIETIALLETVLLMQPKSGGGGSSREQKIAEQSRYLQSRTPPVFNLEQVS
jgi:dynein heavy chain